MFFYTNAKQEKQNFLRQKYEKYNLFELMYLLNKSGLTCTGDASGLTNSPDIIARMTRAENALASSSGLSSSHAARMTTNLNKKAIINTFVDNELDLEFDENKNKNENEIIEHHMFQVQGNNIKWKLQKIIRQTYNIVIVNDNNKHIMEIHTGDIIKIGNKEYSIFMRLYQFLSQKKISYDDDRYDTMCVIIEDFETDEKKEYTAQELIDLFENEDVTYIKSLQFDLLNAEKTKKVEIININ
jgi:hypothetical protein